MWVLTKHENESAGSLVNLDFIFKIELIYRPRSEAWDLTAFTDPKDDHLRVDLASMKAKSETPPDELRSLHHRILKAVKDKEDFLDLNESVSPTVGVQIGKYSSKPK